MRQSFPSTLPGRGVLTAFVILSVIAAVSACGDDGPQDPGLGFVDGSGTPSDGGGVGQDASVADIEAPDVTAVDVPEDTGEVCFAAPGVILPVAAGALSSYSRGAAFPSIRQWADRTRSLGYRGLLLADHQRRSANAPRTDQFSDPTEPEHAYQYVYIFDDAMESFHRDGTGVFAGMVTAEERPTLNIQRDTAILLRGAADGYAFAVAKPETSFDYDVQDLKLSVRVAAPRKTADARVTLSYVYKVRQNEKRLTWVFLGEPGDGTLVTDIGEDVQPPGTTFRAYQLPIKQHVIDQISPEGATFWTEGVLESIELRVDGDAEVVFDEVRLTVDAWFDDYVTEIAKYTAEAGVVFVAGVEHYLFDDVAGQFDCLAPNAFPATETDPSNGLFEAFEAVGCLTVADRPWAEGAGTSDTYVRQADLVEVWHPSYGDETLQVDRWDALLEDDDRVFGIASSFARDIRDLTKTTPHNHVLAASATREDVVAALAAGRSYMTDDIAVRAEFWAERPDCARAEMGDLVSDAVALHATVTCPGGVASARLLRVALIGGLRTELPLVDVSAGAVVPVADWPVSYVRLEATCESGARVVTNPIWISN